MYVISGHVVSWRLMVSPRLVLVPCFLVGCLAIVIRWLVKRLGSSRGACAVGRHTSMLTWAWLAASCLSGMSSSHISIGSGRDSARVSQKVGALRS